MPWCPICKNEYVEGRTHCPDCDIDLVEELPMEVIEESNSYVPDEEELQDLAARAAAASQMETHVPADVRHSELKSSAMTFLLIGGIGFLTITLAFIGVIALPLNFFSLAVMEGVFIIFLIIAITSFRKAMKMLDDITKEADLETRIEEWSKLNLLAEELSTLPASDTPEEMRYFIITEAIRERLMVAFPELTDAHAESLTETYYNRLFET